MTVFDAELSIIRNRRNQCNGSRTARLREIEFKRTRAVLIQALMYICAFLLTWVWVLISTARLRGPLPSVVEKSKIEGFLTVFFPPLQGFLNAMIFVYQKAHTLRQTNKQLSFCSAIKQAIIAPSTVPEAVVSSLQIVDQEIGPGRPRESYIHGISLSDPRRQEITHLSGLRRCGNHDFGTPLGDPNSSNHGASSLGHSFPISLGDIVSVDDDHIDNTEGDRARPDSPNSLSILDDDVLNLSSFSMGSMNSSAYSANVSDIEDVG